MTTTRLANLLIDTVDRFIGATNAAARWQAMLDTANRIGANSVSCTGMAAKTGKLLWAQSSMAPEWVDEYITDDFIRSDPLAFGIVQGTLPCVVKSGTVLPGMGPDPRRARIFAGHARHGYRYFTSHVARSAEQIRVVHFSTDSDPTHLFGPGTQRALEAISAIVTSQCTAPSVGCPATIYGTRYRDLNARERDVLSLMAQGHSDGVIADQLGIGHTALHHIKRTARGKMGADSGAQALSIALSRGLLDL